MKNLGNRFRSAVVAVITLSVVAPQVSFAGNDGSKFKATQHQSVHISGNLVGKIGSLKPGDAVSLNPQPLPPKEAVLTFKNNGIATGLSLRNKKTNGTAPFDDGSHGMQFPTGPSTDVLKATSNNGILGTRASRDNLKPQYRRH